MPHNFFSSAQFQRKRKSLVFFQSINFLWFRSYCGDISKESAGPLTRLPPASHRAVPWHCHPVFRIRLYWVRIWIQHFRLSTDPDPIRIQGFDDQKLEKFTAEICKKNVISEIAIYLSLGLHKGRPSYRRSLQPSIENIQHLDPGESKQCEFMRILGSTTMINFKFIHE